MSTEQTADSQPAVADEVNPNRHVVIRILARHDCEGRLDTQTMQVDQSSTAELDILVDLGPLADINMADFEQALRDVIIKCCNDHDFKDLITCELQFVDYFYDDSGVEDLRGISDEELRGILGGDDSFIRVEWCLRSGWFPSRHLFGMCEWGKRTIIQAPKHWEMPQSSE